MRVAPKFVLTSSVFLVYDILSDQSGFVLSFQRPPTHFTVSASKFWKIISLFSYDVTLQVMFLKKIDIGIFTIFKYTVNSFCRFKISS